MVKITDRAPSWDGKRFFFQSYGGLGLSAGWAEAARYASQGEDGSAFGREEILLTAVSNCASWRSGGCLSDHLMRFVFRRSVCPAEAVKV
jgi:hypothetical protein